MFLHIGERHVLTRVSSAMALAEIILDGSSIVSSLILCRSSSLKQKKKERIRESDINKQFSD